MPAWRAIRTRSASTLRGARPNWLLLPTWPRACTAKRAQRHADELRRSRWPSYRAAELAELQRNFYGFDPSYHVARYHFVHKTPASWTPRHLAIHRDLGWSVPR
jgi:putative two-component system hydrogenase maturation factor HypX/HoxX